MTSLWPNMGADAGLFPEGDEVAQHLGAHQLQAVRLRGHALAPSTARHHLAPENSNAMIIK